MGVHVYPILNPPSHLPPHPILQGHPSAPALNTLSHASNLDWRSISHMIIYMFQCHSPKSSHPHPLPQSPKDCSIHLCLFCCLSYGVIVTIYFFAESFLSQWELDSISSRFDFLFTYIPLSFTVNLQASNLHRSVSCSVFQIPGTTDC